VELKNSIVTRIAPWSVTLSAPVPLDNFELVQTPSKGSFLGSVHITNGSGSILISSIKFDDNGAHTGSDTTYDLMLVNETTQGVSTVVANNPNLNFNIPNLYTLDANAKLNMMVLVNKPGGAKSGDTWMLSLKNASGVTYFVTEDQSSLGYDNNGDGDKIDYVLSPLFAEGTVRAGTVRMQ
jgi:hypothetical protein